MAKRPKKRSSYHHGNLYEELLIAAEALLPVVGARQLSLREVARSAGVSNMAPYRHFRDKEALLAALAERGFARLAERGAQAIARHPSSPLDQLVDYGVSYVQLLMDSPELADLMFGRAVGEFAAYPSLEDQTQVAFGMLGEILESCARAGKLRTDTDVKLTLVFWSFVHGLGALVASGRMRLPVTTKAEAEPLLRAICWRFVDGFVTDDAAS
jgi:AcrR family transcriptional regulator